LQRYACAARATTLATAGGSFGRLRCRIPNGGVGTSVGTNAPQDASAGSLAAHESGLAKRYTVRRSTGDTIEGLVGCMARVGSSPLRRIRRAPQTRGFLRAASCPGTASVGAWQQIRRALGGRATDVGTTGSAALRTSRSQGPLAPLIDLRTESLLVGQGVRPVERAGVHPGGARPRTRLRARVSSCAPRPWPKNAASRPKYAIAVPPIAVAPQLVVARARARRPWQPQSRPAPPAISR
jgi:hypothetical protein